MSLRNYRRACLAIVTFYWFPQSFSGNTSQSWLQLTPSTMTLLNSKNELVASSSPIQIVVIASIITSVVIALIHSLTSQKCNDNIPLYTPQGDYKKRWSYDNPHALQEAYSQVSMRSSVYPRNYKDTDATKRTENRCSKYGQAKAIG